MLKKWQPKLHQTENFIAWPKKHISHGFDTIMMRLHGKTPEQLGLSYCSQDDLSFVFDEYIKSNQFDKGATRTRWEQSVLNIIQNTDQDQQKIKELIGLSCEGYHYNFGICLSNFSALENAQILVETRYSQAFDEFMEIEAAPQATLAEMPVLSIPKNLPMNKPELWKQIVDPFSDIAEIQNTYKQTMSLYSAGQKDRESLQEAATDYSRALSSLFGQEADLGSKTKRVLGLGFFSLGALVSAPVAALLWLSETELLPAMMKRFHVRNKEFFKETSSNMPKVDLTNKSMITSVPLNKQSHYCYLKKSLFLKRNVETC